MGTSLQPPHSLGYDQDTITVAQILLDLHAGVANPQPIPDHTPRLSTTVPRNPSFTGNESHAHNLSFTSNERHPPRPAKLQTAGAHRQASASSGGKLMQSHYLSCDARQMGIFEKGASRGGGCGVGDGDSFEDSGSGDLGPEERCDYGPTATCGYSTHNCFCITNHRLCTAACLCRPQKCDYRVWNWDGSNYIIVGGYPGGRPTVNDLWPWKAEEV